MADDRDELAEVATALHNAFFSTEGSQAFGRELWVLAAEHFTTNFLAARDARVAAEALHKAATEIEAYLQEQHAAPMWWHVSDIVHTVAGCAWSDEAGEDGEGEYDCVGRALAAVQLVTTPEEN